MLMVHTIPTVENQVSPSTPTLSGSCPSNTQLSDISLESHPLQVNEDCLNKAFVPPNCTVVACCSISTTLASGGHHLYDKKQAIACTVIYLQPRKIMK